MNKRNLAVRRSANLKAVEALGLPTPRLQFRWEALPPEPYNSDGQKMRRKISRSMGYGKPPPEYRWRCHYELVVGLHKNDIRNPHEYKKAGEYTVALGGCVRTSGKETPIWDVDGVPTVDVPYRDGSHSHWDGIQLGRPPVYAICGEHVTTVKVDWDRAAHQVAEFAAEDARDALQAGVAPGEKP